MFRASSRGAAALLLLAVSIFLARPATAMILEIEIVTTIVSTFSLEHTLSDFASGDAVIVRFAYDTDVPDTNLGPNNGLFQNAVTEAEVLFPDSGASGLSFFFNGGISSLATADDTGTPPIQTDSFAFATAFPTGDSIEGDTVSTLTFVIAEATIGSAPTLVVNERPNPPFTFGSIAVSNVSLGGVTSGGQGFADIINLDAGTGTVVVPEPGVAGLLGLGLLGLASARRR